MLMMMITGLKIMAAEIIKGAPIAEAIRAELGAEVQTLKSWTPTLAIVGTVAFVLTVILSWTTETPGDWLERYVPMSLALLLAWSGTRSNTP